MNNRNEIVMNIKLIKAVGVIEHYLEEIENSELSTMGALLYGENPETRIEELRNEFISLQGQLLKIEEILHNAQQ